MGYPTQWEFDQMDREFCRVDDLRRERVRHCDKVVAVLGDDLTYPCKLEAGHAGRCEPDYDAGS